MQMSCSKRLRNSLHLILLRILPLKIPMLIAAEPKLMNGGTVVFVVQPCTDLQLIMKSVAPIRPERIEELRQ